MLEMSRWLNGGNTVSLSAIGSSAGPEPRPGPLSAYNPASFFQSTAVILASARDSPPSILKHSIEYSQGPGPR